MSSVEYRVQVSTEDITRIRSQFESLDLDGNGQLTAEEASRVLEERGIDYDRQNIINMIQAADTNSDGFCSWAEFLAIMLDIQFHTERNQKEFDFADKDGDGKISFSEMVELFKELDLEKDDEKIQRLFNEIDLDNNGYIDREEFERFLQ